jgi:hypothetical protein
MANFSKPPFTDVLVKLKDPSGNVIGELNYDPDNARVVSFPLSNRTDLESGEYEISFELDNLLLVEKEVFSQEQKQT